MEQENQENKAELLSIQLSAVPYIQNKEAEKVIDRMYQLFNKAGDVERVRASTASDAIKKATIANPFRVQLYNPLNQVLLMGEEVKYDDEEGEEETVVQDAAAESAESNGSEEPQVFEAAADTDSSESEQPS